MTILQYFHTQNLKRSQIVTLLPYVYFRGGIKALKARLKINLWKALNEDTWNMLSLLKDHQLPHLPNEHGRLKVDIVGFSEIRRPSSGKQCSADTPITGPAKG